MNNGLLFASAFTEATAPRLSIQTCPVLYCSINIPHVIDASPAYYPASFRVVAKGRLQPTVASVSASASPRGTSGLAGLCLVPERRLEGQERSKTFGEGRRWSTVASNEVCPKREFDKNNCGLGRETRKRVDHDKRGIIVGL